MMNGEDARLSHYIEIFPSSEDNNWYFALRMIADDELVAYGEGFADKDTTTSRAREQYPGFELRETHRKKKIANLSGGSSRQQTSPPDARVEAPYEKEGFTPPTDRELKYGKPSVEDGNPPEEM